MWWEWNVTEREKLFTTKQKNDVGKKMFLFFLLLFNIFA